MGQLLSTWHDDLLVRGDILVKDTTNTTIFHYDRDVPSLTITGAIAITGDVVITGGLKVTGFVDFDYTSGSIDVDIEGNVDIKGGLNVQSTADAVTLASTVQSSFIVTGNSLLLQTATSGELDLTAAGLMDVNAGANLDVDVTGTVDILATTTFSIDGTGNSNVSATSGDLVISTITSGELDLTSAGLMDVNAGANLDMDVTGTFDLLATTTFSIDGTGASNVSATSGNLTISTITSGTLILESVALIDMNAGANLDIDVTGSFDMLATTTFSIDGTGASNVSATSGNLTISTITSGTLFLTGVALLDMDAASIDIDATNAIELDSAAANISFDAITSSNFTLTSNAASDVELSLIATGNTANARNVVITAANAGAGAAIVNIDGKTIDIDATNAIEIDSAAAGVSIAGVTASDFTVTGAAQDLTLSSVGGSVNVSSTENAAQAIYLHANGGVNETIQLHADQSTAVNSVYLLSDLGGITLTATGLASADAINLEAPAGGVDIDGALQVNIASSQAAADAIYLNASAGGVTIYGALATADSINLSTVAGGGIDIDAGTSGIDILTTGAFSFDGAGASNITTSLGDLTIGGVTQTNAVVIQSAEATVDAIYLNATAGGVTINGGIGTADAINMTAAGTGGIDMDCGTGGFDLLTTGVFSIDGTGACNVSATSGNMTLSTLVGGNVVITSVANVDVDGTNVYIDGSVSINIGTNADLPIDMDASTLDIDASGALTIDSATSISIGTNADLPIDMDASTFALDASGGFSIDSNAAASNITVTNQNLTLSTAGAGGELILTSVGLVDIDGTTLSLDGTQLNVGIAADIPADMDFTTLAIDASSGYSIDGVGACNVSANTGGLTVSTLVAGTLLIDAVALLDINAGANLDMDITGTMAIDSTNTTTIRMTTNSVGVDVFTLQALNNGAGTANIVIDADGAVDIDAVGAVTIDGATVTIEGVLLAGGANTFSLTNGTASLDVAAGCALDVDANVNIDNALTVQANTSITAALTANAVCTLDSNYSTHVHTSDYSIPFSAGGVLGGGNDRYLQPNGESFNIAEALFWVVPHACTISKIYVNAGTAPGGADTLDVYVMKNGAQQAMTAQLSGAATTGNTAANPVSLVAGDRVTIFLDNSATSLVANVSVTIEVSITTSVHT